MNSRYRAEGFWIIDRGKNRKKYHRLIEARHDRDAITITELLNNKEIAISQLKGKYSLAVHENKELTDENTRLKLHIDNLTKTNHNIVEEDYLFKEKVFKEINKRIETLQSNSKQCHLGGSHEKGMEFTRQAELLERLKNALDG